MLKFKITELKIKKKGKDFLTGYVVNKQNPYYSNNFIRYSGGGIAYDDPHKLTKGQRNYLTKYLNSKYKRKLK
jgi:hypothetical protein